MSKIALQLAAHVSENSRDRRCTPSHMEVNGHAGIKAAGKWLMAMKYVEEKLSPLKCGLHERNIVAIGESHIRPALAVKMICRGVLRRNKMPRYICLTY